ncbi:MAG: hypothetical protein C0501_02050 [Isosphaera sp.]|nr:hypothetical protein [Isosphaera sp.]
MQLLASSMMWGAAAVSIPIALHFFYKARYRPLPWAPMRFLKEAIEQTSRRLKFQEWVLLALRCLALLLLALAISRPASSSLSGTGRGGAIDAVFVLDTSYSMDARDGDKTRLERARAAAAAVLDTLPKGSSCQVITCSDRAALLGPRDKFNLDEARALVARVKSTSLSSDLFPGLTEALAAVKAESNRAREVYVFSDLQEDALNRQQGAVRGRCDEIKKVANLVFVRCGVPGKAVPNVAVADVSWKTEIPHTKTSVPFVVSLRNTGAEPVKGVKVALALDGKMVEKDEIQVDQIDPGQTYPVTLTGGLDRPGVGVVSVTVKGDDLPGDNVLYKTILVRDKVGILLVDGSPKPENPTGSGDHFVKTALNPGKVPNYYIDTETVSAAEAGPKDLDGKEIVYLLNAPVRTTDPTAGLSPDFLRELARFVRGGGGLVISCGDLVEPEDYNKALGSRGAKLLPFDLKKELHAATEAAPFYPAADQVDEASFLGPFRKSPYAEALQRVAITRMLDASGPGGGRVLARTTGGFPYVASKVVDAGEVIFVAGALDEQWGNFSADPGSFHVPLAVFTVTHLTGRKVAGGTETAGTPLVWQTAADPGAAFDLVGPALPDERFRPRTKLTAGPAGPDGRRPVTGTDTGRAGVYHIVPAGKADEAGPIFAVNPDPREGQNVAPPADREVAEWVGFTPAIVQAGAGTETAVENLRTRSEWTEWALLGLLIFLVAESAWAWFCGLAR